MVFVIGVSATVVNNDKLFEITKNIEIFVNVYNKLNAQYVDEVDPSALMRTGIDAMVHSLDPYTIFWSESQIESYRLNDENKYQGFGAEIKKVDDYVTIIEPYEGGPAVEAGLKAGDKITMINGVSTKGKSEAEVDAISMGVPGTLVTLMVERMGESNPIEVKLTRGEADRNNVPYSGRIADNIGYITLTTFTADAGANIKKALVELKKEGPLDGVVIDLRNNGGGLLREAIAISNLFIPKDQVVVSTRSKVEEQNKIYKTKAVPYDVDLPIAVLINGRSASASEIVSGVIQDYDRGVIIGQRSYGKGLVQNTGEVGYNSRMKLTISKYYIPSRRCIQAVEYENGEPVDIADEKRSKFKTANGRVVLDGGGVAPDVEMDANVKSEFTDSLIQNHIIFKYVNQYVLNHDSIEEPREFKFTEYDDFKAFVAQSDFDFKSNIETELEKLIEETKEKNNSNVIDQDLTALKVKLDKAQASYVDKYKDEITKEIELDIISRYYYQAGKAAHRLNGDEEIQEAIRILNNKSEYNSILGK